MIILGYSGVGKRAYCEKHKDWINLDSSIFHMSSDPPMAWVEAYCYTAIDLCDQGYNVFMSAHPEVLLYIGQRDHGHAVSVLHPSLDIKDDWLNMLGKRAKKTHIERYEAGYIRAVAHFEDDYNQITNIVKNINESYLPEPASDLKYCWLRMEMTIKVLDGVLLTTQYNLEDIIKSIKEKWRTLGR